MKAAPFVLPPPFRRATGDDAPQMAELVNIAGNGLPLYLWAKSARAGQSAWDVGRERAGGGIGGFAFHHTVVRDVDGKIAACLIGYPLADSPKPTGKDVPAPLVPLLELADLAPESWYLNVLATYPEHRGKGYGTELLRIADRLARDRRLDRISLIASDANAAGLRLYEKNGYAEYARRPIVKEDWEHAGENWLLFIKPI